jgi:hypothetical protein
MDDEGVFSFDDVDVVVRPMVTTPLLGQGPSRSTTTLPPLHTRYQVRCL